MSVSPEPIRWGEPKPIDGIDAGPPGCAGAVGSPGPPGPPPDAARVPGETWVWSGGGWMKMIPPVWPDPETTGLPPAPLKPVAFDPDADPENTALLEVLLCDDCGMELYTAACGPMHAYLADNPLMHKDVRPLVDAYRLQLQAQWKICSVCPGDVPLAAGNCPHLDVRDDQVRMSHAEWARLVHRAGEP